MLAIGYYIQLLELHELDENDMYAGLEDAVPDLYAEYKTWREELDVSDRRLRLLDQAEADTEWDPLYEDILEQGSGELLLTTTTCRDSPARSTAGSTSIPAVAIETPDS